jgi:hypothetical protein
MTGWNPEFAMGKDRICAEGMIDDNVRFIAI